MLTGLRYSLKTRFHLSVGDDILVNTTYECDKQYFSKHA